MSTVTIRGLSDETHENLRQLAASNNRSMEAEAREALDQYCGVPGVSWAVVDSQVTLSPRFAGLISGLLALFTFAWFLVGFGAFLPFCGCGSARSG